MTLWNPRASLAEVVGVGSAAEPDEVLNRSRHMMLFGGGSRYSGKRGKIPLEAAVVSKTVELSLSPYLNRLTLFCDVDARHVGWEGF